MKKTTVLIFVLAIFFMATGCMKLVKQEEVQKAAEPSTAAQPAEEKPAAAKAEEVKEEKVAEQPVKQEEPVAVAEAKKESQAAKYELLTIYFDFDRFTIRDDMSPTMDKNVQWLKKNDNIRIRIEGHADERGTNEYNIALGERRAQSVKKYLVDSGVNEARLSTISYGEEKPADPGHNEEAWAKNRRAEFVIVR